jgi:hypothetical protein
MKNRICFTITLAGALVCALPTHLAAQVNNGAVYAGGPIQIGASDHAVVCATNLGATSLSVSFELVDAMTGATLLQQSATLAAAGTTTAPVGACLDSATASRAIIGILIGRVAVNPQPLPPQTVTLVASLEAAGTGTSGPVNPRIVSLQPLHPPQPCILVP